MCGNEKLWTKKAKVVEYQGSGRKGEKGTLGSKDSLPLNEEWGVFASSFLVISSMLINPWGNLVVIISLRRGEGGSRVGSKTVEGDSGWETSDSGCSIYGSVSSMSKTSPILDSAWATLVIYRPKLNKPNSTSCVGFTSVSTVSDCKTIDVSDSSEVLDPVTLTFQFLYFPID